MFIIWGNSFICENKLGVRSIGLEFGDFVVLFFVRMILGELMNFLEFYLLSREMFILGLWWKLSEIMLSILIKYYDWVLIMG